MSGRSKAISHTTLHEAAQGNRLPSWATTVEFVKACGADPAAFRERWEQADRAIRSVGSPVEPLAADQSDAELAGTASDDEPSLAPPSPPAHRRRLVLAAAVVLLAAVIATVVVVAVDGGGDSHRNSGEPETSLSARLTPADCPVHQSNPPPAPPAHAGDASAFIADLTLP